MEEKSCANSFSLINYHSRALQQLRRIKRMGLINSPRFLISSCHRRLCWVSWRLRIRKNKKRKRW